MRRRCRDQSGQSTVEWVGLVLLVALIIPVLVMGFITKRVPGSALAISIAEKLVCAASLGDCTEAPSSELSAAYGPATAALVRHHAPDLRYEAGSRAVPVDFRSCRSPVCGDAVPGGTIGVTDTGEPVTAFTHIVKRGGSTYIQYWLYYADSATLRGVPVAGARGYHEDDWESVQVRVGPGGRGVSARASSHHGYAGGTGVGGWLADAGYTQPAGWRPDRGKFDVSGGSHANHVVRAPGLPRRIRRLAVGEPPPQRWTPAGRLRLVPIERLADSCSRKEFAISAPWCKRVYSDPEYGGTG